MVFVGGEDFVAGLKAIGIQSFVAANDREGVRILRDLVDSPHRIICISEDLAETIQEEIEDIQSSTSKSIVMLPARNRARGFSKRMLRALAERAAGTDVFQDITVSQ